MTLSLTSVLRGARWPGRSAQLPRHGHGTNGLEDGARLLIVSNRLPLTVTMDGDEPVVRRSSGGLASGLEGPHERSQGLWFGWDGAQDALSAEHRDAVAERFRESRTVPVPLSPREVEVFYEDVSNGVLWPVCHDRLDRLPLRIDGWDVYESVNARFADAVADAWRPGDVIWVHDYQLMRLPALLRERLSAARIGFFLHIPFPGLDVFESLPRRRWLLEGMLGADLVGFHTRRYRANFTAALGALCGMRADGAHDVRYGGRRVRIGVFPIGVDAQAFATRAASRTVATKTLELRGAAQRLIVGVDRLDYSKGIPRRLVAFERLLRRHPEWRGRVRLIQVAVPSRERVGAYRQFKQEVEALIGRINGELGTPTWTPIHYVHRSISDRMLLALYRAADVMLVTPVRDGMNLVAKEFAASRVDEDGVLVLSELTGAADELTDALLVNPYDVDAVADAVQRALTMDISERRERMRALRAQVFAHDVHRWSTSFLHALTHDVGPAASIAPRVVSVRTDAKPMAL